jgi:hypothetical protein
MTVSDRRPKTKDNTRHIKVHKYQNSTKEIPVKSYTLASLNEHSGINQSATIARKVGK